MSNFDFEKFKHDRESKSPFQQAVDDIKFQMLLRIYPDKLNSDNFEVPYEEMERDLQDSLGLSPDEIQQAREEATKWISETTSKMIVITPDGVIKPEEA